MTPKIRGLSMVELFGNLASVVYRGVDYANQNKLPILELAHPGHSRKLCLIPNGSSNNSREQMGELEIRRLLGSPVSTK
jgi:hypothetical protein